MGSMVHLEINTPLFLDTAILFHTICILHSSACIFLHSCPCMTSYLLIVLLVPCSWQCNEERGNPSRSLSPPSLQWSSGCEHPWQSREYGCHARVAKQPQPRHKATRSTWRACRQRNSQRVFDLKLRKGLNQKLEIQPERHVEQPSCEKNKSPTGNRFRDNFESATLNLQRWTWANFWPQRQTAENIRHLSEEDCYKTCGMFRSVGTRLIRKNSSCRNKKKARVSCHFRKREELLFPTWKLGLLGSERPAVHAKASWRHPKDATIALKKWASKKKVSQHWPTIISKAFWVFPKSEHPDEIIVVPIWWSPCNNWDHYPNPAPGI